MSVIEYRREYVVERLIGGGAPQAFRFDDVDEARIAVAVALVSPRIATDEQFGGRIAWYIDESVPATFFDEKISDYAENLHGGSDIDDIPISRDDRYLLVEENYHGGYWLNTGDSATSLVNNHVNQEYASEWELVAVFDLVEQRAITVEVTTTVTIAEE